MRSPRKSAAIAAAIWIAGASGPARASTILVSDYLLDGSYVDRLGNSPNLSPQGGTLNATNYSFGADQGLSLSNAVTAFNSNYSIAMRFQFSDLSGYRKILDFKNLASDNGFYNLSTDVNYFNFAFGPSGALAANTYADVVLTRDGSSNLVVAYVNGASQFSFTDSTLDGVFNAANNIIQFFHDDNVTGAREASGGIVDRIQLYNGALTDGDVRGLDLSQETPSAVPEPATVTMLGMGVASMLGYGWRRKAATV